MTTMGAWCPTWGCAIRGHHYLSRKVRAVSSPPLPSCQFSFTSCLQVHALSEFLPRLLFTDGQWSGYRRHIKALVLHDAFGCSVCHSNAKYLRTDTHFVHWSTGSGCFVAEQEGREAGRPTPDEKEYCWSEPWGMGNP